MPTASRPRFSLRTMHCASHWLSWGHTRPQIAGEQVRLVDDRQGAVEVADEDVPDEAWDVDATPGSRRRTSGSCTGCSARPRRTPRPSRSRGSPPEKFVARIFGVGLGHRRLRRGRPASPLVAALALARTSCCSRLQTWPYASAALTSRSLNRACRVSSSSKSTLCPSKSGPSTQANLTLPSTVTRHEPHMPVPSTMIEFRTDHRLRARRAGRLDARAHHRHGTDGDDEVGVLVVDDVAQRLGHEAGAAVAAVVGADDELVAVLAEAVLPEHEVLGAEADDAGGPCCRPP